MAVAFNTIGAALDEVEEGMTIRLLDNAVYDECLLIMETEYGAVDCFHPLPGTADILVANNTLFKNRNRASPVTRTSRAPPRIHPWPELAPAAREPRRPAAPAGLCRPRAAGGCRAVGLG